MATKQQIPKVVAALVEFQEEFSALSIEEAQFVIQNTKEAITLFVTAIRDREKGVKKPKQILRLISGGKDLMIEDLDGQATIAKAKGTFKSFIDNDFKNWGLNKPGKATKQIMVDVQEMVEDATFIQIFTSIDADLDKVAMTQHQIIRFCEKHPAWLRQEGYATLFLMKEGNEYFVVSVYVYSDGLYVFVLRLGRGSVWYGEFRPRLVSPQLIPLEQ